LKTNPQNNGLESIPSGVGSLTGNKFIPQATKKHPPMIQIWPKIASAFSLILFASKNYDFKLSIKKHL